MSEKGISTHIQYKLNHRTNNIGTIERRCSQCQEWQEENYDNFYFKNKNKPELGYSPECKKCAIARTTKNSIKDPDKILANILDWQDKNKERFATTQHDYNVKRKDKQRVYTAEYQRDHPEQMKIYTKNHRHHDITTKEWQANLKAFNNACAYCGLPQEEHIVLRNGKYIIMSLHKEHVDDDGYNDVRNSTPSCQSCNSIKGGKTIEELLKLGFIKEFTQERYNKIIWWITEGYKQHIEDKPPYRILREQNEDKKTFHFNLWSVDEMRNIIKIIATRNKKKEIITDIENGIIHMPTIQPFQININNII